MASCGGTLIKLLLGFFNLIWLGIGLFIIYLGYKTFELNSEDFRTLVDTNFKTGALVLIGFGIGVVLIAAIGFLGACCESSTLLNFYGFIMFIVLVGNVVAIYYGYKYRETLYEKINDGIKRGVNQFKDDKKIAYALQQIQYTFECCGWEGPSDYSLSGGDVPASCCKQTVSIENSQNTCTQHSIVYSAGCKESPVISKYFGNVIYSAYALILVQLIIILSACCLARDLRAMSY